ncbi:hypothetical protein LOTGIDRAFT_160351 [Lottia gigantea]|uniref:C2H2-type domain-containing protein n=1 Tax=Lottia gigantea TaxID=225164 RepID=V4C2Q3_LOTGI|nr:hypothetical protein LOTGIDRAFT_160351 [Lottia gigantea]ESO95804.1 hypothetical protein LOTGIDRAFT_160351 [Lottia gigantea]
MGDQGAASTINIPQLPFKQESVSDTSLLNNTFSFEEVAGTKFVELLSRNLISALSCTGNIQHPESLLCIDIPYFWCNYCSYKTIQKSEMLDHLHCHRFHCQFCEFSAFTRCEVLKHSKNNHQNETNFRLFWFCVLNSDQSLIEENNRTNQKAALANLKRPLKLEAKQSEVVLLKKIKLEKPDGELLETSVEVPHSKHNDLPVDSTSLSDSLVIQRMDHFRNTLSQLSDEMNDLSGHADPYDTEMTKAAQIQLKDNNISENTQGSYLRTILTTEDNSIPTSEPLGNTHNVPAEPVVKMEIVDDSYVDNQPNYSKVAEEKSLTTLLRKDDVNRQKSSSPGPANLPILRTMLQCPEILSSSTASSVSGEGSQDGMTSGNKNDSVDSCLTDESEDDNDDDDDDADYMPTKNYSSGEEWSYTKKGKGKKRKKVAVYSCPNCSTVQLTFQPTKNHLFRAHPNANLVLREEISNTYVFICPSLRCRFRHSIFTTFVRHLEKCDIFTEKYDNEEGYDVMSTLLATFRNVLERSKIPWMYACCLCTTKFTDYSNAVSHAHTRHLTCPLSGCLFKLRNKTVVIYCKHCKAEVSVSNWSVLLNKNCKHHKLSEANLTLDQSSPATSSLPSTSTSQPPSKADSTPQLRAMLQRKTEQGTDADGDRSRGASPDGENLPASRMLQWLMTEGGRMMHLLK